MKVAVIGSRGFNDYEYMKSILSRIKITELISGGAIGADSMGEKYANENKIIKDIIYPDYEKFGKYKAPLERNTDIVNKAELIVAFWDESSTGTLDAITKAKALNKEILIINYKK